MHVLFPWQLLIQTVRFRIVGQTVGAHQSIASGAMTVVAGLGAHWEASLNLIAHTEAQYLAARGFLAAMEGMLGTTDVPAPAWFRPRDNAGHMVGMADVGGIDDAQTMEHFGFANAPLEAATLTVAAPLRATVIKVAMPGTTGLRPGHRFSMGDALYEVQLTWVDDAGENIVQFQPPLRAEAAAGDTLEIFYPRCRMRLATADEREAEDTPIPARFFTLNFIEAQ